MDITQFLSVAVLGSTAANFLHWRLHKNGQFHYEPKSAWLRNTFHALSAATLVTAVLFMTSTLTWMAFGGVGIGAVISQELYSIIRRRNPGCRL